MKKKECSDEIVINNTVKTLVQITNLGYRGSGNNRPYYINDHNDDTEYILDTQTSDKNKSVQDAME